MGGIKGQRREMSNPVRLIFLLQVNIQIPRMNLDNFKMKYTFTRPHRTETHLHCGGVWCSKWMANGYATEMLEEAKLNWHSRRWLTLHCSCIGSVSIQQRDHSLIEWVEKLWWYSSNTPILCWYPGYSNGYCGGNTHTSMGSMVVLCVTIDTLRGRECLAVCLQASTVTSLSVRLHITPFYQNHPIIPTNTFKPSHTSFHRTM